MKISEFAQRGGVTASAIRFYERKGVLRHPRRTRAGYRDYDAAMLESLAFIRRAEEVGFTLTEIAMLIAPEGSAAERRQTLGNIVAHKLAQMPLRRRDLAAAEEQLKSIDSRLKRGRVDARPERWFVTPEEATLPPPPSARRTPSRPSALAAATKEARRLRHHWLGAEHVLLGILADKHSEAAETLNKSGLNLRATRAEVQRVLGIGVDVPEEIALTPRVQRIIGIAQGVAWPSAETTTEHLLIGMLRGGDSVALGLMRNAGVNLVELENRLTPAH